MWVGFVLYNGGTESIGIGRWECVRDVLASLRGRGKGKMGVGRRERERESGRMIVWESGDVIVKEGVELP